MKEFSLDFSRSRLVLVVFAMGVAVHFSGCTSGSEQNDVEAIQDVEGSETESQAAAGDDGTTPTDAPAGDDALLSESFPEDALGSSAATDGAETPSDPAATVDDLSLDPGADTALLDAPAADASSTEPALDLPPAMAEETPPTPTIDESSMAPAEDLSQIASTEVPSEPAPEEPAPAKPNIPLQKIASAPWQYKGKWVNGVYFARPGDSLSSISQLVYGESRVSELKKINPTYSGRGPKPGEKVYYVSSKRPDDSSKVMTWHEESGQAPQIYVAKAGDNIRTVSKDLLGYDGAWKEVWSSNLMVESKGKLDEGTELHYWPTVAAAPPAPTPDMSQQASAEQLPPPAPDMAMPPPPAPDANALPPPPAPDMAASGELPPPDMGSSELPPPPPPMEDPMQQQANNDLPPPPPPMDMAPPPPPPPVDVAESSEPAAATPGAMDEDTMMALGTAAIAAAGIAGLMVVRRRRKQRELESQFGDSTHVG